MYYVLTHLHVKFEKALYLHNISFMRN